ncbi:MAG: hypothetical protein IJR00_04920, partial [Lachnospiraceae bacterium]|nr:hypothetical protein [Lachnospiraceae bacterium]
ARAQQTPQQAAPQQMPQQTPQAPHMAMPPQSGVSYGAGPHTAEKKSGGGKKIGIALAAMALIAAVIIAVSLNSPSSGSASQSPRSTTSPGTNSGVNNAAPQEQESEISLSDARKGDIITFGSYEQDGNTANGTEPIEWEVLEMDSESVLVISKHVLDCVPYHDTDEDVTWETCTLRTWLNSSFYSTFTAAEQSQIMESDVVNRDNEYYGTPGGNNTRDKVFCLSVDEIYLYYHFNANHDEDGWRASEALITGATPHPRNRSLITKDITKEAYESYLKSENYSGACIGKRGVVWWLRSPGESGCACFVDGDGSAGWYQYFYMDGDHYGVRPAMRLRR